MTPAQCMLLKKLINADRRFWDALHRDLRTWEDRGVEVGYINGVNPKTAQALVECGLIEVRDHHAYLGSYDPYQLIEERV